MTRPQPVYRSSQRLTELARSIHGVYAVYQSKRAADEARVQYTPGGLKETRGIDALTAYRSLKELQGEARREGERAVAEAHQRAISALRSVAPPLDAATAIIAVEAARMVAADPSLRNRLLNLAEQTALDDPGDRELAALLVHVPLRLTGMTAEQRDTLRVGLVPEEARAYYRAKDESEQIIRHVGTVAEMISDHAQASAAMPAELLEAVVMARQAQSVGHVEPMASLEDDAAEQQPEPAPAAQPEEVES